MGESVISFFVTPRNVFFGWQCHHWETNRESGRRAYTIWPIDSYEAFFSFDLLKSFCEQNSRLKRQRTSWKKMKIQTRKRKENGKGTICDRKMEGPEMHPFQLTLHASAVEWRIACIRRTPVYVTTEVCRRWWRKWNHGAAFTANPLVWPCRTQINQAIPVDPSATSVFVCWSRNQNKNTSSNIHKHNKEIFSQKWKMNEGHPNFS